MKRYIHEDFATYICNFLSRVDFIPRIWKYSPHASHQGKRTFTKHAYDLIDAPKKRPLINSDAQLQ